MHGPHVPLSHVRGQTPEWPGSPLETQEATDQVDAAYRALAERKLAR
jgi:hypothetical protein